MGKALHQLRVANGITALKLYRCLRSYTKAARDPVGRHSAETMQALDWCLRASEAHKAALYGLWDGLLHTAPFPGREKEMQLTMARYEVVFSDLHAMQMPTFDL